MKKKFLQDEFINYINNSISQTSQNKDLVNYFFSNNNNFKRYIVGKNEESLKIIEIKKIDGIIDDFDSMNTWNGVNIIRSNQIFEISIILNTSTSISPVQVYNKFSTFKNSKILQLSDILKENKIPLPEFILQMRYQWMYFKSDWFNLYDSFHDEISREVLVNLILFRLTADITYMKNFTVRLSDQYFEEFMNFKDEIFVDVGGFDGDTSEIFCTKYQDYKKVLFFEPSSINMTLAKIKLSKFKNITFFQMGLSNKIDQLNFNENSGSSSSIIKNGQNIISTSTLDLLISEPVSFIKMDIEGWEMKAIEGCINHIINDTPKLAITVYHNASDFIEIPKYILSFNNNYNIYLRHYTSGWSETVMYFVPKAIQ